MIEDMITPNEQAKKALDKYGISLIKIEVTGLEERNTCSRCGRRFEITSYGGTLSRSVTEEYLLVCPKCYLKWVIEFELSI